MANLPEYKVIDRKTVYCITFAEPIEELVAVKKNASTIGERVVVIHGETPLSAIDEKLRTIAERALSVPNSLPMSLSLREQMTRARIYMAEAKYTPFRADDMTHIRIDDDTHNAIMTAYHGTDADLLGDLEVAITGLTIRKRDRIAFPRYSVEFFNAE